MGQKISREECEKEVNKVRRQEQENAATELRNAISKVESKFQQELKKLSDANLQREQEQQRVISKLQEQEKKCSSLVESLSSNLADTKQQVVALYKRVQQLETQALEEQQVSASRKRRAEELEDKIQRLTEELESAKAEREKKISNLEQVINATTKDLDYERKRFKGARQRIRLLVAQLRACYATSEEMEHVLAKQQEELGAMQKALEEKELENASTQTDSNQTARNMETSTHNEIETMEDSSISSVETKANKEGVLQTSSDQNATELSHEGDMMQEG